MSGSEHCRHFRTRKGGPGPFMARGLFSCRDADPSSEATSELQEADVRLRRSAPRQFGKCAVGHSPQPFQRDVSLLHALYELFGDMLSAPMVAPVWQTSADLLEHDLHIRGCPFIDVGHFDTKLGYRCQSIGVNLICRRSISSQRASAYCFVDSLTKR
jgi:hypothetical protein